MMSDTAQRDPSLELFIVLSRAYAWVNAHAVRDIRRTGLNPTEFGILEVLYHLPVLCGQGKSVVE